MIMNLFSCFYSDFDGYERFWGLGDLFAHVSKKRRGIFHAAATET